MDESILKLQKDILSLHCRDGLVSILIYGSIISDESAAKDIDIIIVVKKVDFTINSLFELLASRYSDLDFNVYSYKEILSGLSFYTREFKLEYIAKGLCIYGENIFQDES